MTPDTQMTFGVSGYLVKHALLSNTVVTIPDICNFCSTDTCYASICLHEKARKLWQNKFPGATDQYRKGFLFHNYQIDPHLRIGCSITLTSVCSFFAVWRYSMAMAMVAVDEPNRIFNNICDAVSPGKRLLLFPKLWLCHFIQYLTKKGSAATFPTCDVLDNFCIYLSYW